MPGTAGDGAVLITGNGHVRRDLGVPRYLQGAGCFSLGLLEVGAGKVALADYLPAGGIANDFVWFTARATREDPCRVFAG